MASPNTLSMHALSSTHAKLRYCIRINHYNNCLSQQKRLDRLDRVQLHSDSLSSLRPTNIATLPNDPLKLIMLFLDEKSAGRMQQTCRYFLEFELAIRPLGDKELLNFARYFELIIVAAGFVNRGTCHGYSLDPCIRREKQATVRAFTNKFIQFSIKGRMNSLQHTTSDAAEGDLCYASWSEQDISGKFRFIIDTDPTVLNVTLVELERNEVLHKVTISVRMNLYISARQLGTFRIDPLGVADRHRRIWIDHHTSVHEVVLT